MPSLFDKNFWKFSFGFLAIVFLGLVSLFVLSCVGAEECQAFF